MERVNDLSTLATQGYGDLVGVAGDPLVDVRLLEAPAFVMKGGDVVQGAVTRGRPRPRIGRSLEIPAALPIQQGSPCVA